MEQPKGIIVKHSADKMKAYVSLTSDFGPVTAGMVLTELLNKGVVHGINDEAVRAAVADADYNSAFVEVASGTEPQPGAGGKIEMLIGVPDGEGAEGGESGEGGSGGGEDGDGYGGGESGGYDDYGGGEGGAVKSAGAGAAADSGRLVFVESGDTLARHVPPEPGVDGMDVFGNSVSPPEVDDVELTVGEGVVKVSSSSNPDIAVATCDGVLRRGADGKIEVRPFKEISGDIDKAVGRVSFTGDLKITGSVCSGVTVVVSGSLEVGGNIESASVRCGGALVAAGRVHGAGAPAVVECGGDAETAGIENSKFLGGGAVTVAGDIINSEVTAKGRVKAAVIAGGKVAAAGGVSADRIGYDSNNTAPTVIDVGGIHRLVGERAVLMDGMVAQKLLSEGCVSELFSFVRDNMGPDGKIPREKLHSLEWYEKNLTESIEKCRELEKSVKEFDETLGKMSGCNITANEVYPNVTIKLGFANREVKEVMRNVLLKPSGVMQ